MAPSDSKDNNINMYQPSKLKSKEVSNRKNTKLMAKYGPCAKTGVYCEVAEAPRHEARDIEWDKIWWPLHRVIQHRRLGLECVEYVSALGGIFYLTFSRFFSVAFSNSQVNLVRSQCFEQPQPTHLLIRLQYSKNEKCFFFCMDVFASRGFGMSACHWLYVWAISKAEELVVQGIAEGLTWDRSEESFMVFESWTPFFKWSCPTTRLIG